MMKNVNIGVGSILFLAVAASCTDGDIREEGPVLASIETEDDAIIEFYEVAETGGIVVSEVGPAEVPSRLAAFVAQDATPLEMYLALTHSDEAPLELEIHHASVADTEPRDLSASFRSYSGSTAAADCSYTPDHAWWEDWEDLLGWAGDYGTYPNHTSHYWQAYTADMFTHLCNLEDYDGTGAMSLKISDVIEGTTFYTLSGIDKGERGTVYMDQSSAYHYASWALGPLGGQTNSFKHSYLIP